MVKHVILWQLKDELSDAEKAAVKAGIKEGLEGLAGLDLIFSHFFRILIIINRYFYHSSYCHLTQ